MPALLRILGGMETSQQLLCLLGFPGLLNEPFIDRLGSSTLIWLWRTQPCPVSEAGMHIS